VLGDSGGLKATLEDIKIISEKAKIKLLPHFIMGHSMGRFLMVGII
jgi:hypothetical protein